MSTQEIELIGKWVVIVVLLVGAIIMGLKEDREEFALIFLISALLVWVFV